MQRHNDVVVLDQRLNSSKEQMYPDLSEDAYFQLDAIDTVLRMRDLSHQEIEDGIVDGTDDGGIDAVYTFLNDDLISDEAAIKQVERPQIELEIIQVKKESGFGETPVQKIIDNLPVLLTLDGDPDDMRREFNTELVDKLIVFRELYLAHVGKIPDLRIRTLFITKSVEAPNTKVLAKADRLESAVQSSFPDSTVKVHFHGATDLNAMARERKPTVLDLKFAEQPISAELGGMIGLVRLGDYFDFVSDEEDNIREAIFEENVRGFEGNTNINKGITKTLRESTQSGVDFWWLNNGVTIIGDRVNYAQKSMAIEDPQVVNGLQTSRSIFNHFKEADLDEAQISAERRHVLVRVIEAEDEQIAGEIVRATNSQNFVPSASLRAAEPFQRSIEEFLHSKGRFYERRKNFYKNQGKERASIVSVLELAQAIAAIRLGLPQDARGRPSSLVRDKMYSKVFDEKDDLEYYWRCLEITEVVDRFLRSDMQLSKSEASNLRFHLARFASAIALRSSRPKPKAILKIDAAKLGAHLPPVYDRLIEEREKLVTKLNSDHARLAKSKEFSEVIAKYLSKSSEKQRWAKKLHSGWAVD